MSLRLWLSLAAPGCCSQDGIQYGSALVDHLVIRKTDDAITVIFELLGSTRIVFSLVLMDLSIYLNDQSDFGTAEVNDIRTQWMLATELQTGETTGAKTLPQQRLGRRHMLPEHTRHPVTLATRPAYSAARRLTPVHASDCLLRTPPLPALGEGVGG